MTDPAKITSESLEETKTEQVVVAATNQAPGEEEHRSSVPCHRSVSHRTAPVIRRETRRRLEGSPPLHASRELMRKNSLSAAGNNKAIEHQQEPPLSQSTQLEEDLAAVSITGMGNSGGSTTVGNTTRRASSSSTSTPSGNSSLTSKPSSSDRLLHGGGSATSGPQAALSAGRRLGDSTPSLPPSVNTSSHGSPAASVSSTSSFYMGTLVNSIGTYEPPPPNQLMQVLEVDQNQAQLWAQLGCDVMMQQQQQRYDEVELVSILVTPQLQSATRGDKAGKPQWESN